MLHRPWIAPLVVGFWCVTCGWLLGAKILPAFQGGAVPGHNAFPGTGPLPQPVGWTVHWNGSPIGWALTLARRAEEGGTLVESRLQCDRLPLHEMLPAWAGTLVPGARRSMDSTTLAAAGRAMIDVSGKLRSFASTVRLPGTSDHVALEGRVAADGEVTVVLRAGELRYEMSRRVPEHVVIGDELAPQATLPGLYEGRRWTVPAYSPLRPGNAAFQVLHAIVGGEETIFWDNRLVNARVVTYREDPSNPRESRCRLWVDRSGRVLRHESSLLGARMEFVRRTDAETERLMTVAFGDEGSEPVMTVGAEPEDPTP